MRARGAAVAVVGRGTVGGELLRQIAALKAPPFLVVAVADRSGSAVRAEGFDARSVRAVAERGSAFPRTSARDVPLDRALLEARPDIVVDATADETGALHREWLLRGWRVVTANKRPVCGPQELFDALTGDPDAYAFECACGAGLPVVSVLRDLSASGDRLTEIRAMPSGTLGHIFASCASGARFAEAVLDAKRLGYTEPDPRDDLSGADVARKALILARLAGRTAEMRDIAVSSLVPDALAAVDVGTFIGRLASHSGTIDARFRDARSRGATLRYLAVIDQAGVRVGIEEIGADDPFASLLGPENMFSFRTARYDRLPIAVRGPGAGAAVTAAGLLADAVRLARRVITASSSSSSSSSSSVI